MKTTDRINGFDALRSIAMWLGVLLHAMIVYKASPEPTWPHDPQWGAGFLDWLYAYIHVFRMPLFFMVAGFFARFVIYRSGKRHFIKQRFKRIFIPLFVGVIVIIPVTFLPFHFYNFHYVQHQPVNMAWDSTIKQTLRWVGLGQLWFLYYLIFFYCTSLAVHYIAAQLKISIPPKWREGLANISIIKLIAASFLLFALFSLFRFSEPPVYTGIWPNLLIYLYNGFFYAAGWLLHINMKSLTSLKKYPWVLFVIGTVISILHFIGSGRFSPLVEYGIVALETISLIAGFTGLFIRYFHAENRIWRYLADSAYWVYIIHMFFIASLQVLLYESSVPGFLRLPVVVVVTSFLSLLTYQYFVRYTIIGEYLNGKKIRNKK